MTKLSQVTFHFLMNFAIQMGKSLAKPALERQEQPSEGVIQSLYKYSFCRKAYMGDP